MVNKSKDKKFITCYGFDPQVNRDIGIAFYE